MSACSFCCDYFVVAVINDAVSSAKTTKHFRDFGDIVRNSYWYRTNEQEKALGVLRDLLHQEAHHPWEQLEVNADESPKQRVVQKHERL